ncbi:UNVERIFIED_CONTAM: hypothetical protein GTU68_000247 [Idotea baltica]|nr:hypothetical protein [Idotea baltica]
MTEKFCSKFAYCIPIAESGAVAAVEEVFDLGLALTNANIEKGATSFKGKCTTCHSIDDGGPNGTGPNLHNVVGASFANHAGFGYSDALSSMGGTWTYEELDHWLRSPSKMVSGTTMSFAGVPRDDERANIIAYLAANTTGAPAFPAPLPIATEGEATDGDAAESETTEGEATENDALETDASESETPDTGNETLDGATPNTGTETHEDASIVPASVSDTVEDAVEATTDTVEDAAGAAADTAGDVIDAVEGVVEDAADAADDAVDAVDGMEAPDQTAFDNAADTEVATPETTEEQ